MKTKELFDELNRRLVYKILDGEYKLKNSDSIHHVSIIVEEDGVPFHFCFWTANTEKLFRCYHSELNTIDLNFTEEEREVLYNRFRKVSDAYKEKEELATYNRLKEKFESKNS